MNAFSPRALFAALLAVAVALSATYAAPGEFTVGSRLDALVVGTATYRNVVVRSLNARTVVIMHAGGLASIRLRDLDPELKAKFNYDPAADLRADETLKAVPPAKPKVVAKPKPLGGSEVDRVLQQFGRPVVLKEGVNLRPQFSQLGIGVRNQGRRPSCSVFAVVSALEYQSARLLGKAEDFSEDYLIWATQKQVSRPGEALAADASALSDDVDAGFTLTEVVNALRAYGIPRQHDMPDNHSTTMRGIAEPPPEVVTQAQANQRVFVHQIPGRDTATRIANVIHALNAGMPVPVGMAWPNYRALRTGYLSAQKPMENAWHAVTLVGYQSKSGRIEDTYFIFKNSWGVTWGQEGYGTVTYGYLNNYLADAVLLEVQAG